MSQVCSDKRLGDVIPIPAQKDFVFYLSNRREMLCLSEYCEDCRLRYVQNQSAEFFYGLLTVGVAHWPEP